MNNVFSRRIHFGKIVLLLEQPTGSLQIVCIDIFIYYYKIE